jgi:hypothetical protein
MKPHVGRGRSLHHPVRMLSVVTLALTGLIAPMDTASASAIDTSTCSSDGYTVFCLPPDMPFPSETSQYCSTFSNGLDYETAVDTAGVHQDWTFSNGTHPCLAVDWFPVPWGNLDCRFYMYVPDNGYADANVYIGWWTNESPSGVPLQTTTKYFAATLPEATTAGWVKLNMKEPGHADGSALDVVKIQFMDNNGQTGTVIGWGAGADHGIKEECP